MQSVPLPNTAHLQRGALRQALVSATGNSPDRGVLCEGPVETLAFLPSLAITHFELPSVSQQLKGSAFRGGQMSSAFRGETEPST